MIIIKNFMFDIDKIQYIDIQERPQFDYETKKYNRTKFIVVLHVDFKSHDFKNFNLVEFESKKEAVKYMNDLGLILNQIKSGKLEKVEL